MSIGSEADSGVSTYHRSVLEKEVMDLLIQDREAAYLDATLGGGGHSRSILDRLGSSGSLIALDRDPDRWSIRYDVPGACAAIAALSAVDEDR